MNAIPDAWPPSPPGTEAPMFPLPGVFLFPGQILPLHVFEPRYRCMVDDLLDTAGRLVIATVREGEQESEAPAVLPVAGLGEITHHDKLPDGRYVLLVLGLGRVRIEEIESDRPYRRVRYEALVENIPTPERDHELHRSLVRAIRERAGIQDERLAAVPTPQLVDILAQCLSAPQDLMESIFSEADVGRRAQRVLIAHSELPPTTGGRRDG